MEVNKTALPGVLRLRPRVFRDGRGLFLETWNKRDFDLVVGQSVEFVQDNFTKSVSGTLRGLHYQTAPTAQGKLVRVTHGRVYDVAVDVREGSPTRGRWTGVILDAESCEMMWIPPGFAHGFLVMSDSADVVYKATAYYSTDHERVVRWNDPALGIEWPLAKGESPLLSPKDAAASCL